MDCHCPTPRLETPTRIELAFAALQAAASPFGHDVMAAEAGLDPATRSFKGSRSAVELLGYGGRERIRTSGPVTANRLAGGCIKPLCHPSVERAAGLEPASPTWQAGMSPATPCPRGGPRRIRTDIPWVQTRDPPVRRAARVRTVCTFASIGTDTCYIQSPRISTLICCGAGDRDRTCVPALRGRCPAC